MKPLLFIAAIIFAVFSAFVLIAAMLIRCGQEAVKWLAGTEDTIEYNRKIVNEWRRVGVVMEEQLN